MVDLEALGQPDAELIDLPVAARRHFLLLFDYGFTTPTSFEKARLAAYHFVENDLAPSDLVAVATFSTRDGVKVPLGFTPDRTQALLTLQQLGHGKAGDLKPDPLRIYVGTKNQLRDAGSDLLTGLKNEGQDVAREQVQELARSQQRGSEIEGRRDVKILSRSLQGLAAHAAPGERPQTRDLLLRGLRQRPPAGRPERGGRPIRATSRRTPASCGTPTATRFSATAPPSPRSTS